MKRFWIAAMAALFFAPAFADDNLGTSVTIEVPRGEPAAETAPAPEAQPEEVKKPKKRTKKPAKKLEEAPKAEEAPKPETEPASEEHHP